MAAEAAVDNTELVWSIMHYLNKQATTKTKNKKQQKNNNNNWGGLLVNYVVEF